jgi:hypothetical protein
VPVTPELPTGDVPVDVAPPGEVAAPTLGNLPNDSSLDIAPPESLEASVPPIDSVPSPLEVAPPEGWRPEAEGDSDIGVFDDSFGADKAACHYRSTCTPGDLEEAEKRYQDEQDDTTGGNGNDNTPAYTLLPDGTVIIAVGNDWTEDDYIENAVAIVGQVLDLHSSDLNNIAQFLSTHFTPEEKVKVTTALLQGTLSGRMSKEAWLDLDNSSNRGTSLGTVTSPESVYYQLMADVNILESGGTVRLATNAESFAFVGTVVFAFAAPAALAIGGEAVIAASTPAAMRLYQTVVNYWQQITGQAPTVERLLEQAAKSQGPYTTVYTGLTKAPEAGRTIFTAIGPNAEATARYFGSLHGSYNLYTAQIPTRLIYELEMLGIAGRGTLPGGGTELWFNSAASKYVLQFFTQIK